MLGQIYFNTATQMYSSLVSSRQTTLSRNNFRQVSPKRQRARSVTAWALFQLNTFGSQVRTGEYTLLTFLESWQ
jgi:hypothetical protein